MNKMFKNILPLLIAGFTFTTQINAGLFDNNTLELVILNKTSKPLTILQENSPDEVKDVSITKEISKNEQFEAKKINWTGEELYSKVPGLIKITRSDDKKLINICDIRLIVGMDKIETKNTKPEYKKSGLLQITLTNQKTKQNRSYYANRYTSHNMMYLRDYRLEPVKISGQIDLNSTVYVTINEETNNTINISISNNKPN